MRTTSIPAILFFAFINCVLASAVASGQQQELTSNVFAVAAPPECLVFSAWGGQQAYEADSDNATEKLMSEPEIKEFVEDMIRRTGLILPAMDSSGSKETYELLHQFGPKISRIMLTKPGSFFVESFDLTDRGEPENFKAAMLIDAGQDAAGLAEVWSKLLGNEESKQKEIAGVTFNSTVIGSKPSVEVLIGHRDNVLLIAIGQQTLVDTMKRLKEAKNIASYLSEFQSSSGVRSMNSLSYINVKSIRQKFVNTLGIQADAGFRFLGLGNATAIETCSGLGPKQWLSRVLVKLEGKPEGLLGLSDADGLSAKDLSSFPKDSLFAMGASLDAKQALAAVRLVVSAMSGGRGDFNRAFREIEGQTGVNVEDDIFANLGSSWTLYNGAGDGWFAGLAMTTSVKDVKALNSAIDKIVKFALSLAGVSLTTNLFLVCIPKRSNRP